MDSTYSLAGETSASTKNLKMELGVVAGQMYDFKVRAVNAAGDSPDSPVHSILAADVPAAPDAPFKLNADITKIKVGWTAPTVNGNSPLTGYKLYYNGGGSGNPILANSLADLEANELDYTLQGALLTPGERYTFTVSALNILGEGLQSPSFEIIAATIPGAPAAPIRFASGETAITI